MKEKNILRDIFDTLEEGILVLNSNFNVELLNQNFLNIFEVEEIGLLGKSFFEIFDKFWDKVEIRNILKNTRTSKEQLKKYTFNKTIPSKGECTITMNARNLTSDFFPSHILLVFQDITESEKNKMKIQQVEKQLITAQRLESIALLSSGIAHDLNNILGVILGYSELSLKSVGPNHPLADNLNRINESALKGAQLNRQLLAFSRRQILSPQDINLNNIIKDLMTLISKVVGEHIKIQFYPEETLKTINADPIQIEQVLINLCINAKDAMPEGGKLIIETKNIVLEQEYIDTHISAKVGNYSLISITDTGIGMSDEVKNKIFEPFFTTKPTGKGTGLGLSVVHGIVYQHNGFINVYSEVGKGTTFKIYLPSVDRPSIPLKEKRKEEVHGGYENILLVEDEPGLRSTLKAILEDFGYSVIAAENGEEALKIFLSCCKNISLVISDVIMPKMSGMQLLEKLKESDYKGEFLFISGYTNNMIHHNFILDTKYEILMKPFTPLELGKKVREILDKEKQK